MLLFATVIGCIGMPRTLLVLALFALCPTFLAAAETQREVVVPGFSCFTGTHALRLPKSLQRLRQLSKLEAEKGPRTEAGWEQYRVLYFHGLEVGITLTDRKDDYALEYVKVMLPQWNIAGLFRVGAPAENAFKSFRLEQPTDGIWKLWGPGPEQALITIKAGLISEVSYSCYSG